MHLRVVEERSCYAIREKYRIYEFILMRNILLNAYAIIITRKNIVTEKVMT